MYWRKEKKSSETVNVKAVCYIGKDGSSFNELFPDPDGSVIQDFERHAVPKPCLQTLFS